jgi:hypothetical protein
MQCPNSQEAAAIASVVIQEDLDLDHQRVLLATMTALDLLHQL